MTNNKYPGSHQKNADRRCVMLSLNKYRSTTTFKSFIVNRDFMQTFDHEFDIKKDIGDENLRWLSTTCNRLAETVSDVIHYAVSQKRMRSCDLWKWTIHRITINFTVDSDIFFSYHASLPRRNVRWVEVNVMIIVRTSYDFNREAQKLY
jgi:hypothetical protein